MTKWRGISALLVLGGAVGCATATSSNLQAGGDTAGADSGGSGSGAPSGGSDVPSAGVPGAGAPSEGAPSAGAAMGGSSSAGAASAGSSSGGKPSGGASSGGAAGQGGAAGHAGAVSGGSSGTSSSGGSAGTAGGTSTGPCANPVDVMGGKSGSFGTTGAVCMRTKETFNTLTCSNWDGRTIKVNGTLAMCGVKTTFAPMIGGYNYFDVSAGTYDFAGFVWYSS